VDVGQALEAFKGRRALAALAVLAVAGLGFGYAVAARARPEPLHVALRDGGRAAASAEARLVLVHVAGAVANPGLYRIGDGSRVDDAVRAAGGPGPDADIDSLNLATRVRDGDKVVVPRRGPPGSSGGAAAKAGGHVNLNTATAAELDTLPGIGPSLAARIVSYREERGGFRSVRDLLKVPGIGPSKFSALEELVTV
jgi:competence protein ComEA